jgi:predicted CXXCH cytochrome family protein
MKYRWVAFILISIEFISTAYGSAGELFQTSLNEPHRFSKKECDLCHADADKDPSRLEPMFNSKCMGCHPDVNQSLSHSVDIAPAISIPGDMPLVNGRMGCITCHYFHPFSDKHKNRSGNLLRRSGKGALFCNACHPVDVKGHVVFENIHRDSFRLSTRNRSLDVYTLQCVECHDRYLDRSFGSTTTRKRSPFAAGWKHPVGVSLERIAARKPRKFNHPYALPQEIRLYDGKIGCGTCHNAFSKEKSMLVMSNWRSRLCLECHKK